MLSARRITNARCSTICAERRRRFPCREARSVTPPVATVNPIRRLPIFPSPWPSPRPPLKLRGGTDETEIDDREQQHDDEQHKPNGRGIAEAAAFECRLIHAQSGDLGRPTWAA